MKAQQCKNLLRLPLMASEVIKLLTPLAFLVMFIPVIHKSLIAIGQIYFSHLCSTSSSKLQIFSDLVSHQSNCTEVFHFLAISTYVFPVTLNSQDDVLAIFSMFKPFTVMKLTNCSPRLVSLISIEPRRFDGQLFVQLSAQ